MSDFVEVVGLQQIIQEMGYSEKENFETIYSELYKRGMAKELDFLDDYIHNYFSKYTLPSEVTLYDLLLLSLRRKGFIVTFNWDPLLSQAYKRWRHLGNVLPQMIFLHGNVSISVNDGLRSAKFTSDLLVKDNEFEPSKLLFPIENKNYNSDPFIQAQWRMCEWAFERAYMVTVYGYIAPKTDVEARSLLLNAWTKNTTKTLSEFDIIDIASRDEVQKSWDEFIVRDHGSITQSFEHNYLTKHPRRTCEAFAFATLQQDPWREDAFPKSSNLEDLENWITPLIAEESTNRLEGKPHH